MAPKEQSTYFGYEEGYDNKVLTLGSLVWDYANPMSRRPWLAPYQSVDQLSQDVVKDQRTDCYMSTKGGTDVKFGIGILDYATIDNENENNGQQVVVAKTGSKAYLLKPHEYLEKSVLKSTEAQAWLSTRLAVSQSRKILHNLTLNHPKLWMLTGIYVMDHATTMTTISRNSNVGGSLAVPIPDSLGIAALLNLRIGAKVEVGSNCALEAGSTFEGSRVWAAQYHEVKAEYTVLRNGQQKKPTQVFLTDKTSVRKTRGESNLAVMGLSETPGVLDGNEDYTEDDWKDFDKRLDGVLAAMKDDESSDEDP